MYVCICNRITDKQVRSAIANGAGTLQELRDELGVGSQCGNCIDYTLRLLTTSEPSPECNETLFYSPA